MVRQLAFASLYALMVLPGLAAVRLLQGRFVDKGVARPSTAPACAGLGPLRVTSLTTSDDEVLVRLDHAGELLPTTTAFVMCLATGADEAQLLARWQRRRTLVWLQQDAADHNVAVFSGNRRVVLRLWAASRAA